MRFFRTFFLLIFYQHSAVIFSRFPGIFHRSHFDYRLKSNVTVQPTLQEMTGKAVQLLRKDPNGFVLFVEGGLIDKAHHETWAKMALDETVEFSEAVADAVRTTDEQDTLIVVTSDHAHTLSMAGYPKRGYNILGMSKKLAKDGMAYTTLSYANGPKTSYQSVDGGKCRRINVTGDNFGECGQSGQRLLAKVEGLRKVQKIALIYSDCNTTTHLRNVITTYVFRRGL